MKILVTGFDPFGSDQMNPAIEAVKQLPDTIAGATIIKLEIPTVFNRSAEVVREAIAVNHPDYVLNIGQAGGRTAVTPERIAINLDDGRIPDNAGYQPLGAPIQTNGQTAYFTQLPVKAMVKAIRAAGVPAAVSNTAGTYVCNHIMYQVQYMREQEFPFIKAGFIHIPYLPEQVIDRPGQPSLSLAEDVAAITAAISTIVHQDGQADIQSIEGTIN
ncbi:pyroglutamyl-peptidase I [Lacticaseibacillus brantae]|uniref:Pyrrolidone-carboxylate peptidase n=1 Tax=Lacticaseibacillus brantae DSM 23927 TaxID=1423727 RepID=A0A0R2B737_9LACO|nr:pyroglutamyl-peptidase I [Lacticaseibacillus brantae]KRM71196.1 pyrrolidone-carboxylate peptidase [Lacticaseibacillus brantae DSM 23927]